MTDISRNYWNKNIQELPQGSKYSAKDSIIIGKNVYYGRSLKNKEKARKIVKIATVIGLSIIFAPLAIPAFALTDVYRDTGRRLREIKYNKNLKFVGPLIKASKSKSVSQSIPLIPDHLNNCFEIVMNEYSGKEALHQRSVLSQVCKAWDAVIKKQDVIDLLNSEKICLNDLAEITTKEEALGFIQKHSQRLTTLKLKPGDQKFKWDNSDINTILTACPHLETLILNDLYNVSEEAFDSIIQLKNLKKLELKSCHCIRKIPPLKDLSQLEVVSIDCSDLERSSFSDSLFESMDQLKSIYLSSGLNWNGKLPKINHLTRLKEIASVGFALEKETFKGLSELEKIYINGNQGENPDFSDQKNLKKITMVDSGINSMPELKDHQNLQVLEIADCPHIKNISDDYFNYLSDLRELRISRTSITKIPSLENLNLRILVLSNYHHLPSLNHLTELETLDITGTISEELSIDVLKSLKHLKVSSGLIDLERLEECSLLEVLSLDRMDFSLDNLSLPNLRIFHASRLDVFPSLEALPKLEQASFSFCKASNLSDLDLPETLKELYLISNDNIDSFPNLEHLRKLVVQMNSSQIDKKLEALMEDYPDLICQKYEYNCRNMHEIWRTPKLDEYFGLSKPS